MLSTFRKSFLSVVTAAVVFAMLSFAPPVHAGSISNFLVNKVLDFVQRGQTYTPPANVFVGLAITTGNAAGCGTEVTGGSYQRVSVPATTSAWSGTQGATTTAVSSGTSGTISNNVAITFTAPTANWGTVVEFCVFDAATAGNLLWRGALSPSKVINNGDGAPSIEISALSLTQN